MASRNKGFDPLSSLFEAPDPTRGLPLPELPAAGAGEGGPAVDMTDPLFKRPVAPPAPQGVDVSVDETPEELARRLAREALAGTGAAPTQGAAGGPAVARSEAPAPPQARTSTQHVEPAAPPEDPVALARRLARQALAKAREADAAAGASTADELAAQDKVALARKLAREAARRAGDGRPDPGEVDKVALARKLAAEAVARSARDPGSSTAATTKARTETASSRTPSRGEDGADPRRRRVSSLTARARKPQSALEAARAAARVEEERKAQALRKEVDQLRDVVQELIPAWLPGISAVYVASAIAVDKRDVLRSLWKAHRSKFLSDGQLERAVGAAAVLSALDQIPEGMLVAAHAVTDASDYLVWLDLDKRALVAAFADARAYFAG